MDVAPGGALNADWSTRLNQWVEEHLPELKGARLAVLYAFARHQVGTFLPRRDGLTVQDVADKTGWSPRHVSRAVQFLVEQQRVDQLPRLKGRRDRLYRLAGCDGTGAPIPWTPAPASVSASNAREMAAPVSIPPPSLSTTTLPTPAPVECPSGTTASLSAGLHDLSTTAPPVSTGMHDLSAATTPVPSFAPVVVVSSSSKDSKKETTTTTTAVCARVRAILSDAGIFGESLDRLAGMVTPELAGRWARWIRWANENARDRYFSPAGLARICLLKDPAKEPESICSVPEEFEGDEPDDPPFEPPDPEPEDAGHAGAESAAGGEMSAYEAWLLTQQELRLSLTRATFETRVRASTGLRWEGNVLVVRVRDPYAKEWLEQRLETTVRRNLTGVVGRHAEVRYVVKDEERHGDTETQ